MEQPDAVQFPAAAAQPDEAPPQQLDEAVAAPASGDVAARATGDVADPNQANNDATAPELEVWT